MRTNPRATLFLILLSACALGAASSTGGGQKLRFAVAAGQDLHKRFSSHVRVESGEIKTTLDGKLSQRPSAAGTTSFERTEEVALVDRYVKVDDRRFLELMRTFEEIEWHAKHSMTSPEDLPGAAPHEEESEKHSDLEGKRVVFTWDAKEAQYARRVHGDGDSEGEKISSDVLERLAPDLDYRMLLPEGEVEVGASWEFGAEVVKNFGSPIPGSAYRARDTVEDESFFSQEFADNMSGAGRATFEGVREIGGVTCAVIKLAGEFRTHGKLPERMKAAGPDGGMELELELKGELTWDVENAHMHALELGGPLEATLTVSRSKGEHSRTIEIEFSGDFAAKIEASR
jgi:hypothetical protein